MRLLTVVTPELEEIGKVEAAGLDAFLVARELVGEPLGRDRWVACRKEAMGWVELVLGDQITRVRWRGKGMVQSIESVLEKDGAAAFVAKPSVMRHFFNTAGFCHSMKMITEGLENAEMIVPPGMYCSNALHMVVWRRKGMD